METSTNTLETINKGKWQWQSNADPWSKAEPPQWESYPLDHNYLIEKAYYDQQKEVDLGDYLVYPLDLLQRKKGNPMAQRLIRRVDWTEDEEMSDRSARYYESELPKTINRIFGGLGDFISFFSRRNPEILDFTSHFKELEKSNDLGILNHKICPRLVKCLEEVLLKPNEEQLKDLSLTQFKKKTLLKDRGKIEELISAFQKPFTGFEEFYRQILRAYTMNTGLYPDLNKYLRNESWMEVDKLLPYAFCLCKAFFHLKLKPSLMEKEAEEEKKSHLEELTSKILYRGTAFNELDLSFYDTTKIQYFSWNSVTSTTTNKKVAEEFMYNSVNIKEKKDPVMFIIEAPHVMESEDYLKWLEISKYSAIPKEKEVILAPGSVFELVEVVADQDKRTTIKIKMMIEVPSLAHRGLMMQGTLQSQMMTEKEAKIMCLDGEELSQALMSLHGNQLLEEVEFGLCIFDELLFKKMLQILTTIEKVKTVKFISCIYEGNRELVIEKLESSEITKIEVIEANDFFQLICNESLTQLYWTSLRELCLNFQSRRNIQDEEVDCVVSQGLKHLTQLVSLNITFEGCDQITDKGVGILVEGFNYLTQLTFLTLNFAESEQITDKGVDVLASLGLKNLKKLTSFTLNLDSCQVTNKGVHILASQISKYLPQLKRLDIDFGGCRQITDEALESLASEGLKFLDKLESLRFNFVGCQQITDNGVIDLTSQGLGNLKYLVSLNLDFEWCSEITDEGLLNLAENGLKFLVHLTSLSLNFRSCTKITDYGLESLASSIKESHMQLTYLTLYLGQCKKITDKGFESLVSWVLKDLAQLTSLNLTFFECDEITDKSIENLACEGLENLHKLISLTISFFACKQITLEGTKVLMSQGLKNLTQLTSLNLNFSACNGVTDKEMQNLAHQSLKHLTRLEFMKLNDKVQKTASDINFETLLENPHTPRLTFLRESSDEVCSDQSESSDESGEDLTEEFFNS